MSVSADLVDLAAFAAMWAVTQYAATKALEAAVKFALPLEAAESFSSGYTKAPLRGGGAGASVASGALAEPIWTGVPVTRQPETN